MVVGISLGGTVGHIKVLGGSVIKYLSCSIKVALLGQRLYLIIRVFSLL